MATKPTNQVYIYCSYLSQTNKGVVESAQKLQPQQEGKTEKNSPVQKQTQEVYTVRTGQKISPMSSARDNAYKHIPAAFIKSEVSTFSTSEPNRAEEAGQYTNEYTSYKVDQEKSRASPVKKQERQNHHWSSPDRTAALARHTPRSAHQNGGAPYSSDSVERRNNSMLANSFSRWSASNGRPDPSILDVNYCSSDFYLSYIRVSFPMVKELASQNLQRNSTTIFQSSQDQETMRLMKLHKSRVFNIHLLNHQKSPHISERVKCQEQYTTQSSISSPNKLMIKYDFSLISNT